MENNDELQRGKCKIINNQLNIEFDDNYEHINKSIEYIIENQIYQNDGTDSHKILTEFLNYILIQNCKCNNNNTIVNYCSDKLHCIHGSNYIIKNNIKTNKNELILNGKRLCQDLIYECSNNCLCPNYCLNRLIQFGPRKGLKITEVKKPLKQYGLTSIEWIQNGAFICEYIGEILTKEEAERRTSLNEINGDMNYIICLNESSIIDDSQILQTFIDPSKRGNIGRYLNHSCEPNCIIISIRIDSLQPRLGIFALKDINPYEELCFDYGGENGDQSTTTRKNVSTIEFQKRCYCGTIKCKKYLPNFTF